jgi:hypothetical protein
MKNLSFDLQTFLYIKNLTEIHQNIQIMLHIFTLTAVTNCPAERYFSCSKRTKIFYDLISIKIE